MIKPPIEELLEKTPGRFALVIASARRAKDINSYFNQLGEGIGAYTHHLKYRVWVENR